MSFLKGREMRNLGQAKDLLKLLHVLQDGHDPAVIGPEELLQGQHGQQLVLGEVVFGELRGIRRQTLASNPQGHPDQRLRRTRHSA